MAKIYLETYVAAPIERVFDLARDIDFHKRSLASTDEQAVAGRTTGMICLGESVTWRARHLGLTWTLTSRITQFEWPTRFVDEQVDGPFARFRHEHRFETAVGGTQMFDEWLHELPFGVIGRVVDVLLVEPWLRRLLTNRNAAIAREAATSRS